MTAYIIRRLLLVIPTLLGIMLINFAVIQIVPGGPVEQMIAQMTGTAVESTARFSGGGEGENLNSISTSDSSNFDSKYRGAQGLDPDIIKEIVKEYGPGSVVDYYGLTPQNERDGNREKFQSDPKCRFLVGTPATGGYGLTLTAANTVIYYSNGYDLEKRLQSEDRAHRIGQKKNVTYVDIIAEDTVDEKIVKALRDKINVASQVLGEELKSWI